MWEKIKKFFGQYSLSQDVTQPPRWVIVDHALGMNGRRTGFGTFDSEAQASEFLSSLGNDLAFSGYKVTPIGEDYKK